MLHPDPQPGLVFQHVLNIHSQVILKYGPCSINGTFSTDSLIFFPLLKQDKILYLTRHFLPLDFNYQY